MQSVLPEFTWGSHYVPHCLKKPECVCDQLLGEAGFNKIHKSIKACMVQGENFFRRELLTWMN